MTMPASISAGDLLIAVMFMDSTDNGASGWPAGWFVMSAIIQVSSTLCCQMAYKYAVGGESNFTLTHNSQLTRSRCYRITGHAGPTRPPLLTSWQGANSAGPPGVTPYEWAQPQDILGLLVCAWENTTPSGGVTGYTNEFNAGSGSLGARCEQKAISSFSGTEDPANYTTGAGNRAGYTILVPSDAGDPDLTFPIVRNEIKANGGSSSTSFNVNLPAQREAGDICVVSIGAVIDTDISSGLPSGWTEQVSERGSGASGERLIVIWKRLDGSETDFTLTMSAASAYDLLACCVYNVDSDATVLSASTHNTSTNANPDPPNLTATASLWMAVAEEETLALVSYPTNYTYRQANRVVSGASIYLAFRQLDATSEDPGTFAIGTSHFWAAATVAFGKANPRYFQAAWVG